MIADAVAWLADGLEQIVDTFGLPGIGLIALLENLFPPTPSEFLYPLAGKLAYDGAFSVWGVVIAGVVGSLAGSLFYYGVGRWLGPDRTRAAVARYGQVRVRGWTVTFVALADYDRAVELFAQWGGLIVLVARLVPLVHAVISIPAGVVRMPLGPFIMYTAVGSALWIAPLTLLGLWLGSNWEQILIWLDVYTYGWYAVIGLAVAWAILRRVRAARQSRTG